MKTLLLLTSLLFASATFANTTDIEINGRSNMSAADVSPRRTVDHYSYNFGQVSLYTRQYVTYTLINTGTTPLTFSQASISGIGFDAFHTCSGQLLPNQKCSFDLIFEPMSQFACTGRFILSFVEDLDIVVDMYGVGTPF